jgi:putative flavoprotein involved in K+ transport
MDSFLDTIVVGGGQAGLSVSWHLTQAGKEHLVLDRGEIGDTWRNRWDSFCLLPVSIHPTVLELRYSGSQLPKIQTNSL